MMFKKQPAQIMVIVLLLLSVLSIIALTATMTTVRDTQEQVQNKKYQQYYSLGEKMIFEFQRFLGTDALPTVTDGESLTITGETDSVATCTNIENGIACTILNVPSDSATADSSETYDVYTEIIDTAFIKGHKLEKDQDIMFDLEDNASNETYLLWDLSENPSWNISYDYLNTTSGDYVTEKAFSGTLFGGDSDDSCLKITVPDQTTKDALNATLGGTTYDGALRIALETTATCNDGKTALDFRIKTLLEDTSDTQVEISLIKTVSATNLQRTMTVVTTTSEEGEGAQSDDNPATVLSSNYLLTTSPLSLFDYVLRTEQGITK